MATPRMKSKQRKEQIAQAALVLLSSQGVAAMTMERTARLVGLAPSAIYRHFKNKAEMIDAVLDLLERQFRVEIEEAGQGARDPVDLLHRLLMQRMRHILEHKSIPRLLYSEEILHRFPEQQEKIKRLFNLFIHRLRDIAAEGQGQGLLRTDMTPLEIIMLYIGLTRPVDEVHDILEAPFDLVDHVHKVWNLFREAVSPPKPKE